MIFTLAQLALAGEVAVLAQGGLGNSEEAVRPLFGIEAGGAVFHPKLRRLHLELAANLGYSFSGGVTAGLRPRLRAFIGDLDEPVFSVFAGGGGGFEDGLRGLVEGGLALDLGRSPIGGRSLLRPRVQGAYMWLPGVGTRWLISIGGVFGRKNPDQPVVTLPPPPPPPPPAPAPPEHTIREGMIWVPGPVCQWLPPDGALAEIHRLGMTLDALSAVTPATVRGDASPNANTEQEEPKERPAMVLIAAFDKDIVKIDGEPVQVDRSLAATEHPPGRVQVEVVGGGRVFSEQLGAATNNAVWLTAPAPTSTRVTFASGSATLNAAATEIVQAYSDARGHWSYRIIGSFSSDGNVERNRALGLKRANAVRDGLIAAGVPADLIDVAPVEPPEPGLSPSEQRHAAIHPVETL